MCMCTPKQVDRVYCYEGDCRPRGTSFASREDYRKYKEASEKKHAKYFNSVLNIIKLT